MSVGGRSVRTERAGRTMADFVGVASEGKSITGSVDAA